MKIQTTAIIKELTIDDKSIALSDQQTIDLEFSAIDTGGGFKDPILDFSFSVDGLSFSETQKVTICLADPQNEEKEITFSYEENVYSSDNQLNGRLKGSSLSKKLIGFVLQLLR